MPRKKKEKPVVDEVLETVYDRIVITVEIQVSKKEPKVIRLTIVSEEPLVDSLYSIGYGSLESLESGDLTDNARMAPILQGVFQSYREVLMDALRELAS